MKTLSEINQWQDMINEVVWGDCLEGMKKMPDNSVDLVLTDPPYELGFMGKGWDSSGIAFNVEVWKEALRVLKPGGHLFAFSGTRTYHRMAVAIEDAGFEIRDMIEWVYGSGFPKSLNIGKAVDKMQGNEREDLGEYVGPDGRRRWGGVGFHGGVGKYTQTHRLEKIETKGTSGWEGWGSALKPAHEPICMARKPLSEKNIAENCLKWGTGGIDIDGSRVEMPDREAYEEKQRSFKGSTGKVGKGSWKNSSTIEDPEKYIENSRLGRWPANLIHDESEEVKACFPYTKGNTQGPLRFQKSSGDWKNQPYENQVASSPADSDNASRFFKSIIYEAKASKKDRGNENNHPTVKPKKLLAYLMNMASREGDIILDPFMGSWTTAKVARETERHFIGFDIVEEYCLIGEKRLEQPPLFNKSIS